MLADKALVSVAAEGVCRAWLWCQLIPTDPSVHNGKAFAAEGMQIGLLAVPLMCEPSRKEFQTSRRGCFGLTSFMDVEATARAFGCRE